MYEPDSYVPLARLDADGERTEQGGLGTTQDAQQLKTSKNIAAGASQTSAEGQKGSKPQAAAAANDPETQYWAALASQGSHRSQASGSDANATAQAPLCEVYYFHTDQVGLPEELSNAQGQIIWQAQYKTWGSTVEERWEARRLHGAKVQGQTEGDIPQGDRQEQNLRFQGQYLDRETGLHYNTFRYYDVDIGRFICPDPIGLGGGINLGSYAPNPIAWIDPWGWCIKTNAANGKAHGDLVTQTAQGKYGAGNVKSEVYIRPLDANGNPVNYRIRADNTIGTPNSKIPNKIIEAKGSANAPFTKNQTKGFPLIEKNGGIIEQGSGKNKITTPIPPTPVQVVRPRDIGNI